MQLGSDLENHSDATELRWLGRRSDGTRGVQCHSGDLGSQILMNSCARAEVLEFGRDSDSTTGSFLGVYPRGVSPECGREGVECASGAADIRRNAAARIGIVAFGWPGLYASV